jgi:glycosyltransferase family protein
MKVLTELETIQYISDNKCSIARYGDGEFKICLGAHAKFQVADLGMAKRMRTILRSNNKNLLVCVPRIYQPREDWPTQEKAQFWKPFATHKSYVNLLDNKKTYGSSFITRPDSSGQSSKAFYEAIKTLWSNKEVLLLKGEGTGFDKKPDIFETAINYKTIIGLKRDAYKQYDFLLKKALELTDENSVIVISLGPTATILAAELAECGRQALDLGHLGMFYAKIHPKAEGYKNEVY